MMKMIEGNEIPRKTRALNLEQVGIQKDQCLTAPLV